MLIIGLDSLTSYSVRVAAVNWQEEQGNFSEAKIAEGNRHSLHLTNRLTILFHFSIASTTTSSTSDNTAIIGGAAAVVALIVIGIILIVLVIIVLRYRKRRAEFLIQKHNE